LQYATYRLRGLQSLIESSFRIHCKWKSSIFMVVGLQFKAIIHYRNRRKKSSQIYKQLTGLTEGCGKSLLLKYYSMKCFTFWENIKTIINSRYRELQIFFKHMSWHVETCRNKGGFSCIFSRLRWPIEPKFSQVCCFTYKLWYT